MIAEGLTTADKRRIYEQELGRCGECGKGVPRRGVSPVYDRITPPELGGQASDANTQLLCEGACYDGKEAFDLARIEAASSPVRVAA